MVTYRKGGRGCGDDSRHSLRRPQKHYLSRNSPHRVPSWPRVARVALEAWDTLGEKKIPKFIPRSHEKMWGIVLYI